MNQNAWKKMMKIQGWMEHIHEQHGYQMKEVLILEVGFLQVLLADCQGPQPSNCLHVPAIFDPGATNCARQSTATK